MKVSELWLRNFFDSSLSISELADQLTNAGIEVDALEQTVKADKSGPEPQGILTLKIPANRGDCLSMEGIARELALITENSYKPIILSAPPHHKNNRCLSH